jgi:YjbE family integral membrane protein
LIEFLGAVGGIILVDLVLSGDNALVIGAAAAGLPPRQQWLAIFTGGAGAIILRIAFAFVATLLLRLPLLQAIGGIVLLFIAIKLLADRKEKLHTEEAEEVPSKKHPVGALTTREFLGVMLTILIADVTMSLDNVLAVGALAHGNLLLLSVGILLSILLLLLGSALVASLIGRLPWLLDVAALVLGWTGAKMILDDLRLGPVLDNHPWTQVAIPALALGAVLVADVLLRWRDNRRAGNIRASR